MTGLIGDFGIGSEQLLWWVWMRIAVIGSGISGLASAFLLREYADVHLFETAARLGGHSHTVEVQFAETSVPVDTGFIVYNPCLLYTSPSPRDRTRSRMPSSA